MRCVRTLVAVTALVAIAAPLWAQGAVSVPVSVPAPEPARVTAPQSQAAAEPAPAAPAAVATSLAPLAQNVTVGVQQPQPAPLPLVLPRRGDSQRNVALMIVGGATLLVGALVGGNAGTIIMIGGGAVGIYGLYQYLQ